MVGGQFDSNRIDWHINGKNKGDDLLWVGRSVFCTDGLTGAAVFMGIYCLGALNSVNPLARNPQARCLITLPYRA